MLWERAFADMFWEPQILLVWLSLCLWSWYNDFPCDSEMWASLFGALWIVDRSPTLCKQRKKKKTTIWALICILHTLGTIKHTNTCRWEMDVGLGFVFSQPFGTWAHFSSFGNSSTCTCAVQTAMHACIYVTNKTHSWRIIHLNSGGGVCQDMSSLYYVVLVGIRVLRCPAGMFMSPLWTLAYYQ